MGCSGSKPLDKYVLEVDTPGEAKERQRLHNAVAKADAKKNLKQKYKVALREARKGEKRKNSFSGGSVDSKRDDSIRRSLSLPGTSTKSSAVRKRFRKVGHAVRASVRLKTGNVSNPQSSSASVKNWGYTFDNFDFHRNAIGKGACGYVRLAQHKHDKGFYAIKCVSKHKAAKHKNGVRHLRNEIKLLQECSSAFLIQCFGTFHDRRFVYLVLNYVIGGELHRLLYNRGRFSNDMAMFYAVEMLVALEYLHSNNIVYRDLKPENVLIAADGHIKIADFGFALQLNGPDGRAFTKVGTPHYLAPEILDLHSNAGYTREVDWWSWGCVVYEMVRGRPAFGTARDSSYAVYLRVMKAKFKIPVVFSTEFKNLVRKVLEPKIEKRLSTPRDLKAHPWFKQVDWSAVEERRLRSPYIPQCTGPNDRSCFDSLKLPDYPYATGEEEMQFRGFV